MREHLDEKGLTTFTNADLSECLQVINGGMLRRAHNRGVVVKVSMDSRSKVAIWKLTGDCKGARPSESKLQHIREHLEAGHSKSKIMRKLHTGWDTVCKVEKEMVV